MAVRYIKYKQRATTFYGTTGILQENMPLTPRKVVRANRKNKQVGGSDVYPANSDVDVLTEKNQSGQLVRPNQLYLVRTQIYSFSSTTQPK